MSRDDQPPGGPSSELNLSGFGFEESDDPFKPLSCEQVLLTCAHSSPTPLFDFVFAEGMEVELRLPGESNGEQAGAGEREGGARAHFAESRRGLSPRAVSGAGQRTVSFTRGEGDRAPQGRNPRSRSQELLDAFSDFQDRYFGLNMMETPGSLPGGKEFPPMRPSHLLFSSAFDLLARGICRTGEEEGNTLPLQCPGRRLAGGDAPGPAQLLSVAMHYFAYPPVFEAHNQTQGTLLRQIYYFHAGTYERAVAADPTLASPQAAALFDRVAGYRAALDYCFSVLYSGERSTVPQGARSRPTHRDRRRASGGRVPTPAARAKEPPDKRNTSRNPLLSRLYTAFSSDDEDSTVSHNSTARLLSQGEEEAEYYAVDRDWLLEVASSQFCVSLATSYRFLFFRPSPAFDWSTLSPPDSKRPAGPLALLCCHPRIYESLLAQLAAARVPADTYFVYQNERTTHQTIVLHGAASLLWIRRWLAIDANLYAQGEIDACDVPRVTAHFPFPGAALVRAGHASGRPRGGNARQRREKEGAGRAGEPRHFTLRGEFGGLQKALLQAAAASAGAGATISFSPEELTEDCNDAIAEVLRRAGGGPPAPGALPGAASWAALRALGADDGRPGLPAPPRVHIVQGWEEPGAPDEPEGPRNPGEPGGRTEFRYQKKPCASF